MKIHLAIGSSLIAALLLSACAQQRAMMAGMPAPAAANASGIVPTTLVITDNPAVNPPSPSNIALASDFELRRALKAYGVATTPGQSLGAIIASIKSANMNPGNQVPGLTGPWGVFGHAFLEMAQKAVKQNGQFDQAARVVTSIHGQITDYSFDRPTGSGYLEVITYFTRTVVPAGQGAPPPKTEAYKWQITVEPGGFVVVERDDSAPDGPFPGTLPFSQAMKDRVDSLGFTRKLWAKGTKIKIDRVWHKMANSSVFTEVFATQPKYARLFQTDAESCIDMLFVGEPPAAFADLQGPPTYCLGRCKHPFIVNTGV